MAPRLLVLLFFFFLPAALLPVASMIITFFPVLSSASLVVQPDVAPVQVLPADLSPATQQQPLEFPTSQAPFSTVPAFPEQSDAAGTCPLDLPDALFPAVYHACSSVPSNPDSPTARLRCCPALAAWLYTAYASTALAVRLPSSADADLPILPDDSESCAGAIDRAMRAKGVPVGWVNETCDVAYCYCGIKLRPLACPTGFAVAKENGKWVAKDAGGKKIEHDCARPGLGGCSRCLRSLRQVTSPKGADGGNTTAGSGAGQSRGDSKRKKMEWRRQRECQLMGLTWLLAKNRTLYLPTATRVLRAFMAASDGEDPVSCTRGHDRRLPLPAEFGGNATLSSSEASEAAVVRGLPATVRWVLCSLLLLLWMALPPV